jgi:hypothetical protein
LATCTDASYFAPIGQIGTHDALPQHGGRPSRPMELRPCGNGAMVRPTLLHAALITVSRYVGAIGGIGYGADRGDPQS